MGSFIKPKVTYALHRGSPENLKDVVLPGAPKILSGALESINTSGRARRAEFAEWLVDEKNPLTARVIANRLWQHVFGAFGCNRRRLWQGAAPSHPELLDWIAAEFSTPSRPEGTPWSMKELIRLLVLSDAFKRSESTLGSRP